MESKLDKVKEILKPLCRKNFDQARSMINLFDLQSLYIQQIKSLVHLLIRVDLYFFFFRVLGCFAELSFVAFSS